MVLLTSTASEVYGLPPGTTQANQHELCTSVQRGFAVPRNLVPQHVPLLQLDVPEVFWKNTFLPEHPIKIYTEGEVLFQPVKNENKQKSSANGKDPRGVTAL